MAHDRFDVVRVPFPFTGPQTSCNRPALVISDRAAFHDPARHSVMAMITSARHSSWPLEVRIGDRVAAGLPQRVDGPLSSSSPSITASSAADSADSADDERAAAEAIRALLGPATP